jgi:hypothetical protein
LSPAEKRPDREGYVVARHRAEQIAASDFVVAGFPGRGVFGVPVLDAMIAAHAGCKAPQTGMHTNPLVEAGRLNMKRPALPSISH